MLEYVMYWVKVIFAKEKITKLHLNKLDTAQAAIGLWVVQGGTGTAVRA